MPHATTSLALTAAVARSTTSRILSASSPACDGTTGTKPASQMAERYDIPFIAGSSSSAAPTERGLKWFMRIAPNDDMETKFFFDYLNFLNRRYKRGDSIKRAYLGL